MSKIMTNDEHKYYTYVYSRIVDNHLFPSDDKCNTVMADVFERWSEPHRYYHNMKHLADVFKRIGEMSIEDNTKHILEIAALFHDIIYDPRKKNNEAESNEYFKKVFDEAKNEKWFSVVSNIIMSTTYDKTIPVTDMHVRFFWYADLAPFYENNFKELYENERTIFKEFQYHSPKAYKEGKKKFLDAFWRIDNRLVKGCETLTEIVDTFRPHVGIYCGSFNPATIGHQDCLEQAEKMFDKVVLAIGTNRAKLPSDVIYRHEDQAEILSRVSRVKECFPFHEVLYYDGLTHEFIKNYEKENDCDVTLVRGLRNGSDLQYEYDLNSYYKDFDSSIKSCYFLSNKKVSHVSSTVVRSLQGYKERAMFLPTKYAYINKD